ncbi:MAG: hypothetical protein NDI75_08055 [Candidatus Didemnitutus sp.]|nr:hypothetical protein [Candidatus Didemnitutus sp.]
MFAFAVVFLTGCATKITRQSRPAGFELVSTVNTQVRYVGVLRSVNLPAAFFEFTWEDESYWYYENAQIELSVEDSKKRIWSGPGGFAVRKFYDEIALFTYQKKETLIQRGAGELVVAFSTRRNGMIVSFEFMVIPNEIALALKPRGAVKL